MHACMQAASFCSRSRVSLASHNAARRSVVVSLCTTSYLRVQCRRRRRGRQAPTRTGPRRGRAAHTPGGQWLPRRRPVRHCDRDTHPSVTAAREAKPASSRDASRQIHVLRCVAGRTRTSATRIISFNQYNFLFFDCNVPMKHECSIQ